MIRKITAALLMFLAVGVFQQAHATDLCEHVLKIQKLPFKDEGVDDPSYNALVEAGEAAIPCLIPMVTDMRKMRDPRQAPKYGGVRVGDVAYFVLVDIANINFVEMLPARVQKRYKTEGVYAYFEFVERPRNREWLRRRLSEWYQKNRGRVARAAA
jgi:hypothetical protein